MIILSTKHYFGAAILTDDPENDLGVAESDVPHHRQHLVDDHRPVQLVQRPLDAREHVQHDFNVTAVLLVDLFGLGNDHFSDRGLVQILCHVGDGDQRRALYQTTRVISSFIEVVCHLMTPQLK